VPARFNLALLLLSGGDSAGAIAELQATLALEPQSAAAHLQLGNALVQAARPREAVAEYRRALELSPGLRAAQLALDRLAVPR
jgi:Tfp pilus assembly protein PilF